MIENDLVLIGGGHAHVQVIKKLSMSPVPRWRITLISDQVHAPYSGMFPGFLLGKYSFSDIHFDLWRMCQNAGVRFILDSVIGIDANKKEIQFKNRPPMTYDMASINVGSEPNMNEVSGKLDRLIPMKPIYRFIQYWERFKTEIERVHSDSGSLSGNPFSKNLVLPQVAMVGGGAAGIEVALVLKKVFAKKIASLHLFQSQKELLSGHNFRVKKILTEQLKSHGIQVHLEKKIIRIDEKEIISEDGKAHPADYVFWATQAGAKSWFKDSHLPVNERGFLQVNEELQVLGHDNLFGAGDCIQFSKKKLPKSGVFAVREGPILSENLLRLMNGRKSRLISYRPQKKSLAIIGTGDGKAVASYGPLALYGSWVSKWKDDIDRRFMARFHPEFTVNARAKASPTPSTSMIKTTSINQEKLNSIYHSCGGCGAKIGPEILAEILSSYHQVEDPSCLSDFRDAEDSAVIKIPENKYLISTVDSVREFLDDPFIFGQLAAMHALNDLWAKGGLPRWALLDLQLHHRFEKKASLDIKQILSGLEWVFQRERVVLLGGHTVFGHDTRVGIHAMGLLEPHRFIRKSGLCVDDHIVLSKPVGVGTLLVAHMNGQAKGKWIEEMVRSMLSRGPDWTQIFNDFSVSAATDVTGFGLARHLWEMSRSSKKVLQLDLSRVPVLEGARETLAKGFVSPLAFDNQNSMLSFLKIVQQNQQSISQKDIQILFDPQTVGGFLIGVAKKESQSLVDALISSGLSHASVIGRVSSDSSEAPQIELLKAISHLT